MIEPVINKYSPTQVSPPGDTLRELLNERSISQTDLAGRMGRPQKTISEILNGKTAITPETALQLELVLGVTAEFWIARERNYRTYLARHEQEECLRKEAAWARKFPIRRMTELGWISPSEGTSSKARNLLEFFGVASSLQWESTYKDLRVAFRKSTVFHADEYSLSAWLRAGISTAEKMKMKPFDRGALMSALREARKLITKDPEEFCPALTGLFSETGVAIAFLPELPKSRASGATMWLSPERALIQLSLRYKTDDHLWFTFFHEAAHVLWHNKRAIFLEGKKHIGKEEKEANWWAADFLIPPKEYARFVSRGGYDKAEIRAFAAKLGLSPGIIVGRLQHDKLLDYAYCNDLKRKLVWANES
jgi:addiction module HigA family antidote